MYVSPSTLDQIAFKDNAASDNFVESIAKRQGRNLIVKGDAKFFKYSEILPVDRHFFEKKYKYYFDRPALHLTTANTLLIFHFGTVYFEHFM